MVDHLVEHHGVLCPDRDQAVVYAERYLTVVSPLILEPPPATADPAFGPHRMFNAGHFIRARFETRKVQRKDGTFKVPAVMGGEIWLCVTRDTLFGRVTPSVAGTLGCWPSTRGWQPLWALLPWPRRHNLGAGQSDEAPAEEVQNVGTPFSDTMGRSTLSDESKMVLRMAQSVARAMQTKEGICEGRRVNYFSGA